jgi:hypothetical protein
MAKKSVSLPGITSSLYELLQPLEAADRQRAINAALTLLGDSKIPVDAGRQDNEGGDDASGRSGHVHVKARSWLRKYGVTEDQIEQVFQLDGETAEVIADDVPAKTFKEKTIQAYLLTGIGNFLKTGEVTFDDGAARAVCKHIGCLNEANHARYLDAKGNLFAGTKKSGWKLTAPGLRKGAELVQAIANGGE